MQFEYFGIQLSFEIIFKKALPKQTSLQRNAMKITEEV